MHLKHLVKLIKTGQKNITDNEGTDTRSESMSPRGRKKNDRMKILTRGLTSFDPSIIGKIMISDKEAPTKRSKTYKCKHYKSPEQIEADKCDSKDAQRLAMITYFNNMPTGSFDIQKKKMKKKLDLIVDLNKQKQEKLESLYLQLGQMTYLNLEGEQYRQEVQ
jgi:hypothetical protein